MELLEQFDGPIKAVDTRVNNFVQFCPNGTMGLCSTGTVLIQ